MGSYVAVVALVYASLGLGGQSECRDASDQAEDVVEGLHGDEILLGWCSVGSSSRVLVGFGDDHSFGVSSQDHILNVTNVSLNHGRNGYFYGSSTVVTIPVF